MLESVGRRETAARGMLGNWVDLGKRSLNGFERNKLYRNLGGSPPQMADFGYLSGADDIGDARGSAPLDVDGDGRLDLVVQNFKSPPVLLINQGQRAGNWLQVRLQGTRCNRDAIGAVVEAHVGDRVLIRQLATTAGYLSGQSQQLHFGLGPATQVDRLVVHWPGGGTTERAGVPAGTRLRIVQQ